METDFGYHIIKLTDVKIPKQRSFDELRAGIETELKTQQAQRKFAESAEAFTNGVYEQSDSLKPVAEKLKLEIKTVAGLGRQAAPAAKGVLANPKFLNAVFASDAIDKNATPKRSRSALINWPPRGLFSTRQRARCRWPMSSRWFAIAWWRAVRQSWPKRRRRQAGSLEGRGRRLCHAGSGYRLARPGAKHSTCRTQGSAARRCYCVAAISWH